jgi:hypothetical protein
MSTDSTVPNPGRIRASDAEREEFAQLVREATGDGRLSLDEGDERLAAVYAAKYRDELRPIVADLPTAPEPAGAAPHRDSRGQGRWEGPAPWDRHAAGRWQGGPPPQRWDGGMRRAFARHIAIVSVISLALIGIWALSGSHFFWPAIPLIFFALGVVRHARWAGRWRYYRGYYR